MIYELKLYMLFNTNARACAYKTILLVHKIFICKVKDRRTRVENEKIHWPLVWHLAVRFDFNVSN